MKKILFIFLLMSSVCSIAQEHTKGDDEKIKALKTAYITETLNLNSKEAEKFWPIYNEYEERNDSLYNKKWCSIKNGLDHIEDIDETTANRLLDEYIALKEKSTAFKKEFFSKLKKVISSRKILMLKKAEHDFHKLLLEKYGEKKH